MTDIASLGLRVESSQVEIANDELLQFVEVSKKAEASAESLGNKSQDSGKKFEGFSKGVKNSLFTLGGIDPRLRAAENLFTRVPLAVFGVAAAVGVLTKAYYAGAKESDEFARAIAASGNSAGYTTDELISMAAAIEDVVGTQGNAARSLAVLASSGKIAAENLQRFTTAAIQLERSVGTPIEQTAERFAALAEKPTEAAAEIQKSFNFLTPAIYSYIRAQERAGNTTAAAAAAQNAYSAATEKAARDVEAELNVLSKAWRSIEGVAAKAWDAMANIGRQSPIEDQIKLLESARDHMRGPQSNRAAIDSEIERLRKIADEHRKAAAAAAQNKAATDAYIRSLDEAEKYEGVWKRINAAWDDFNTAGIKRGLDVVLAEYEGFGDQLEAQRSANLVSDAEYFDQRRVLIEKASAAEIKAVRAQNAELAKQSDDFSVEGIAAQDRIADNNARIAILEKRRTTELNVLGIERRKSLDQTALAYEGASASADRYVQALVEQYRIEAEGQGLGQRERARLQERAQLQERFAKRRQDLEDQLRSGQIKGPDYQKYLQIEEEALRKSEAAFDAHYDTLLAKQGDWFVGVREALNNFVAEAQNVAGAVDKAFTSAFSGMADALVQFATTGKADFKGLATSIIADLLRIQLQVVASQWLQSIFGGFLAGSRGVTPSNTPGDPGFQGPVRARASGGPVSRGSPYLIGEQGPELFVPNTSGYVVPNDRMDGGGVVIHQTNTFGPGSSVATTARMVEQAQEKTKAEVFDAIRRGRWRRVTG